MNIMAADQCRSMGGSVSMCDSIWMYLGQQAKQE